MESASPWSAQQLTEFLASVTRDTDEVGVLRGAVERASEAFEAEAAAIVLKDVVAASVGYPIDRTPHESLFAAAARLQDTLDVPGVGTCYVIAVPLEVGEDHATLVLARSESGFSREEVSLLRAMTRALSLMLDNIRALSSLRERQQVMERLSYIEHLISRRAPLQDVLDAVTRGTAEVLGDDIVVLYFLDDADGEALRAASIFGVSSRLSPDRITGRVGRGALGRSVAEDRLVAVDDYPEFPNAVGLAIRSGVRATIAAPVHEHGQVIGSLLVASRTLNRSYSAAEREVLQSFAEHASLAVTDARTVEALHEAVGDALHKALHDPLTGLANRARFLDRLDHALAIRRRPGAELAVLYVDIDDFKLVNDRFGHAAGDRMLVEVAERLAGCVRRGDTVSRLGGDEFAVLLEQTSGQADAQQSAGRVLDALSREFTVAHADLSISASIGIAVASPGDSPDEVLRNADVAMYRAKGAGKGCAVTFETGMYESLLDKIELEADLRRAVESEDIEVYFQPIVDLENERVVGVEALARWRHPTRGVVPPAIFIPLAEESGVINELGRQVLSRACSYIGGWQQRHPEAPPLSVSVNVSARQLQRPGLVEEVARALAAGGLDPGSLVLEITESVLMQDTEGTLARLEDLKGLGVRLALDDFGTGYSSLSYLRRFPVDLLKIDQSFVSALCARDEVRLIIEAIITLADALGLQSVAEGVEELDELAALRTAGCRLGQGFHFAKPMSAEALEQFLTGSLAESPARR